MHTNGSQTTLGDGNSAGMTMKIRRLASWMMAALLALNVGFSQLAQAAGSQLLTMQQLLAKPQRFEGQRVRTTGFLRLEFEANALYQTRDDFSGAVMQHAIWLDLTNAQLRGLSKLNHGQVAVEGTFTAQYKGHGGKWPCALTHITGVRMWRKPRRN
jgi:hypothetical protein